MSNKNLYLWPDNADIFYEKAMRLNPTKRR